MSGSKVRVEGLREIDEALHDLSKASARGAMRRALLKAAEPLAIDAASRAPVRSTALAMGIAYTTRRPKNDAGAAAFGAALAAGGSRSAAVSAMKAARAGESFSQVWVGAGRHPQAHMQEFGTVHHAPQPFLRPAFEAWRAGGLDMIRVELTTQITRAVERARRKAARMLAKAGR